MSKGHAIRWSEAELAWIEARCTTPRALLLDEFRIAFDRPEITLSNLAALCKRKGWLTGRTGRFEPEQIPHNKGRPMPFHPNSAKTRFRKGNAPANRKPLWSERIGKEGYVEIKVPVSNPYTGHSTRYMHKHRWRWEQANGPLPRGMVLKCLDGDRHNTDPSNWEAIPRAMLPRLNGRFGRDYDSAPAEMKPTIMAVAKLEYGVRQARERRGRSR